MEGSFSLGSVSDVILDPSNKSWTSLGEGFPSPRNCPTGNL